MTAATNAVDHWREKLTPAIRQGHIYPRVHALGVHFIVWQHTLRRQNAPTADVRLRPRFAPPSAPSASRVSAPIQVSSPSGWFLVEAGRPTELRWAGRRQIL